MKDLYKYIKIYYNRLRKHSGNNWLTPQDKENRLSIDVTDKVSLFSQVEIDAIGISYASFIYDNIKINNNKIVIYNEGTFYYSTNNGDSFDSFNYNAKNKFVVTDAEENYIVTFSGDNLIQLEPFSGTAIVIDEILEFEKELYSDGELIYLVTHNEVTIYSTGDFGILVLVESIYINYGDVDVVFFDEAGNFNMFDNGEQLEISKENFTVTRFPNLEGLSSTDVPQNVYIFNPNSNCFTIQDKDWDKFYCFNGSAWLEIDYDDNNIYYNGSEKIYYSNVDPFLYINIDDNNYSLISNSKESSYFSCGLKSSNTLVVITDLNCDYNSNISILRF